MVGLIKAGTPHGGYFGITEGPYAFQHGQIGVLMQLVGVAVCIGTGMVTAFILSFVLKPTVGLHVAEDDQATGLDEIYWGMKPNGSPQPQQF